MDIFEDLDNDIQTLDDNVDYFETLVGEGKKFKDPQALAKGKAESDAYIKLLTQRLDEANKELNARTSVESFIDQMKKQTPAPAPVNPQPVLPDSQANTGIDDSELEKRLEELLARRESQKSQESNAERVKRVLADTLGDKQSIVIKQKSQELGMSSKELSDLATKAPSAFFKLIGIEETAQPQKVGVQAPRSSYQPGAPESSVKNKAYFEKLKATDPKTYRLPKTTGEMMRAMAECKARGIAWE